MKVTVAIDSFKGSLTSMEAGLAAAEGVRQAIPDAAVNIRPLADGGERHSRSSCGWNEWNRADGYGYGSSWTSDSL